MSRLTTIYNAKGILHLNPNVTIPSPSNVNVGIYFLKRKERDDVLMTLHGHTRDVRRFPLFIVELTTVDVLTLFKMTFRHVRIRIYFQTLMSLPKWHVLPRRYMQKRACILFS